MPFVDAILNEVKRVKTKYEQSFGTVVTQVILAGGGSKMPGLAPYAQEQLGLPIVIADPFQKIHYPAALEPIVRDLGPSFAISIGLGIKEFVEAHPAV